MKVILLQDVKGIGKKFEEKEVANGYAANFLIPRQLAKYASTQALKEVESLKAQRKTSEQAELEKIEKKLKDLNVLKISTSANDQGHLFAKIGKKEIAKLIGISENLIILDEPIKEVGTHQVLVRVGEGENAKEKKLNVEVTAA